MPSVLVYCARSWRISTWLTLATAGKFVRVLTCPPLNGDTFPYEKLGEVALVYLRLHGLPDQSFLYGDGWLTALRVDLLETAPRMPGLVVFVEGCYGAKTGLPEAFLDKGAAVVVSSLAPTRNNTIRVGRAGRFGRRFVSTLLDGGSAGEGLADAGKVVVDLADKFVLHGDGGAGLSRLGHTLR